MNWRPKPDLTVLDIANTCGGIQTHNFSVNTIYIRLHFCFCLFYCEITERLKVNKKCGFLTLERGSFCRKITWQGKKDNSLQQQLQQRQEQQQQQQHRCHKNLRLMTSLQGCALQHQLSETMPTSNRRNLTAFVN